MWKKLCVILFFSVFLFIALSFTFGENVLSDDFLSAITLRNEGQADLQWINQFSREFGNVSSGSIMSSMAVRLMERSLSGDIFPEDPVQAARQFFRTVQQADRQLRMGSLPQEVGRELSFQWRRMVRVGTAAGGMEGQQNRDRILQRVKNRGRPFNPPGNSAMVKQGDSKQQSGNVPDSHSGPANGR